MPFAQRDETGEVTGLYARPQPGYAEQWVEDDNSAVVAFLDPPVPLSTYAATKRYMIETGGIIVAGAHIQTDRDSQAMITGAYAYAQANPNATINYKAEGGFVALTAAQMTAIGLAVGAHVQACFAAEAAIDADIAAGAITTTAQIDGDARWPITT